MLLTIEQRNARNSAVAEIHDRIAEESVLNWAKNSLDWGVQVLLEGPTSPSLMAKELGRYNDLLKAIGVELEDRRKLSCPDLWAEPYFWLTNATHEFVNYPEYFCHISARKDSGLSVTFFKE